MGRNDSAVSGVIEHGTKEKGSENWGGGNPESSGCGPWYGAGEVDRH